MPARPAFRILTRAAALLACAAGGALCQFLHTPLPWMIGPLLAMATLKFRGIDLPAPPGGRQIGQIIIASALGLYFTPQVTATTGGKNVVNLWQGRSCLNCHTQIHGSNNPSATSPTPHLLLR